MVYLGYDQSLGHLIINLRTVQLLQVGVTKIVIPQDEKTQQELCCYNHHMNLEIKPLTICQRFAVWKFSSLNGGKMKPDMPHPPPNSLGRLVKKKK